MKYIPKTFHAFRGRNKDKIPPQYDGQTMYTFKVSITDYAEGLATHTICRRNKADHDTKVLIDLTSEDLVHLALLGVRVSNSDPKYLEVYLNGRTTYTTACYVGG